jgi:uncharacterized cupredoxin-like copper-binding protein
MTRHDTATRTPRRGLLIAAAAAAASPRAAGAAGDLSRQEPVVVTVELGSPDGRHVFSPSRLEFETGKLYRLVLRNVSQAPHYFTSSEFAARIYTRKAQVAQMVAGREVVLAEFKGTITEIEVYPGFAAEWWFVPVATGRITDLRCGIRAPDGRTHTEHGMTGEIVIS